MIWNIESISCVIIIFYAARDNHYVTHEDILDTLDTSRMNSMSSVATVFAISNFRFILTEIENFLLEGVDSLHDHTNY